MWASAVFVSGCVWLLGSGLELQQPREGISPLANQGPGLSAGRAGLLGVRACALVVRGPEAGLLTVWAVEPWRLARRGKFFIPESALWLPATQRSLFPLRESRAPRGSLEGLQTNNPLLDENLCPCAGPPSLVLSSDPASHLVSLMQKEREPLWHRGLHLGCCGDLAAHLVVLLPSGGVVWVGLPGAG